MKITNITPVDPKLSAKTGKVTLDGSKFTAASNNKPVGKFDTFTLVGSGESNEPIELNSALSSEKSDLIRKLDGMSEEEKAEVAVGAYLDMQICCKEALEMHELSVSIFETRQEEKAYYNELKKNGGIVSEEGGKYAFMGVKAGTAIDMKSIDAALSDAQQMIDSLITPADGSSSLNSSVDKIFRKSAEVFSAAAGISDDALNLDDDSFYKIREGITEKNFLEKENEAINSIRERSKQLTKVMGDYMEKNPFAKEKMKHIDELLKNGHNAKTAKVLEALEKYQGQIDELPFKLNLL